MYIIKKTDNKITSVFDKEWDKAQTADICINNWKQFDYVPKTEGRLLYNDYGIYVRLSTDEKPLLARHTKQNSPVCTDSCMEFFVRPNENDPRYMNFEFNPFGTMYLAVRTSRFDPVHPTEDKKYFEVQSYVDDNVWIHQFVIPFEFIDKIYGGHTKTMFANLYKCGEHTQKEHYLSYLPLHPQQVDFHRSEYFGEFVLE